MKVFFELPEGKNCADFFVVDLTPGKHYDTDRGYEDHTLTLKDDEDDEIQISKPDVSWGCVHLGGLSWQEVKQEEA